MKQEERWLNMWQKYMDFMHENKRTPSKYDPDEKSLVNWVKHTRKLRNQGKMQESRKEKFAQLLDEAKKYQRVNQYVYVGGGITKDFRERKEAVRKEIEAVLRWRQLSLTDEEQSQDGDK